jgi:hypothetical protein
MPTDTAAQATKANFNFQSLLSFNHSRTGMSGHNSQWPTPTTTARYTTFITALRSSTASAIAGTPG